MCSKIKSKNYHGMNIDISVAACVDVGRLLLNEKDTESVTSIIFLYTPWVYTHAKRVINMFTLSPLCKPLVNMCSQDDNNTLAIPVTCNHV